MVSSVCALLLLWGCSTGPDFVARHEPWRSDEEQACLTSGTVRETAWLRGRSALGGPHPRFPVGFGVDFQGDVLCLHTGTLPVQLCRVN
mgnify:CR=1 FL=1